jgi:hypothetical protein
VFPPSRITRHASFPTPSSLWLRAVSSSSTSTLSRTGLLPSPARSRRPPLARVAAHCRRVFTAAISVRSQTCPLKAHGGVEGDTESAQFFASLSPLEKLLPGYRDDGTPIAKLIDQNEARLKVLAEENPDQRSQQQSAVLLEAEILFGTAGQPVSPSTRSSPGPSNIAAVPTASSDWLRITV